MKKWYLLCATLGLSVLILASCGGTPTPTQIPVGTAVKATPVPLTATAVPPVPPTATVAPPVTTSIPTANTAVPSAVAATATALPPTNTPLPSDTPPPTATPTASLPQTPDPAVGMALWPQLPCSGCHGASAQGDIGPRLAGTGLSFDQVLARVRLGKAPMPAFPETAVSDLVLRHVYAWLRSLAEPTPTPMARPSFPTQSLSEMWAAVNEMKVRADFAKDLPVRVAQDDAGRLNVVKNYAREGLTYASQAIARANQALNEVPYESVKAILRQIVATTNAVAGRFNNALAQNSYAPAWAEIAEAVKICRIDALPWATQAIRDAGLVGTVRVRVVDQNGAALSGAFATVLTAHNPLGGRTDGNGWVTFVNVAAVPSLQVKAYADSRVYHELNMNLSPGQTLEGTLAVPRLPGSGLAPSVSNAAINPASGSGSATVTFAITATDPQGSLDLAEDQIFALNPDLGVAYVLLGVGNDRYQSSEVLPNLAPGVSTWYFFAVDHECNTSNIIPVRYTVQ
jgi:mono/diheme cytochrome c family protein